MYRFQSQDFFLKEDRDAADAKYRFVEYVNSVKESRAFPASMKQKLLGLMDTALSEAFAAGYANAEFNAAEDY